MNSTIDNDGVRVVAASTLTSGLPPESLEVARLKQSIIEQNVEIDRLRERVDSASMRSATFPMPYMWASYGTEENKNEITKVLWLVLAMIDNGCELWQIKQRLIGE